MNICTKIPGTSLLMVLLVTSILSVVITSVWRTTTYTFDIAVQRARHESRFRATQGLLNYGIALCSENFDQLIQEDNEFTQLFDWPESNQLKFKGELLIPPDNESCIIHVLLLENK